MTSLGHRAAHELQELGVPYRNRNPSLFPARFEDESFVAIPITQKMLETYWNTKVIIQPIYITYLMWLSNCPTDLTSLSVSCEQLIAPSCCSVCTQTRCHECCTSLEDLPKALKRLTVQRLSHSSPFISWLIIQSSGQSVLNSVETLHMQRLHSGKLS